MRRLDRHPPSSSLRRAAVATSALVALAGACSSSPSEGDGRGALAARPAPVKAAPDNFPSLGFDPKPSYLPENVLVLTFDDGPDWNNTAHVLDVLRDKHVKASFFINTVNWSDVNQDAPMQDLVKRMVNEGHELANHTVHHLHLPTLSASMIDDELGGVEETVDNIMGGSAPRLTLVRAPFGEPFQDGMGYDLVAPIVAEHGVHVGWNFDTFDYDCPEGDGACVLNNFKNGVKTPGEGAYGVILMHSVHSQTAAALPDIIDYARDNGFEFWSVEDAVCAKLHSDSDHIVDGTTGGCNAQPGTPDAGEPPPPGTPDAGEPPPPGTPDAGEPPPPGTPDAGTSNPDHPDPNGDMTGSCGCRVGGASGAGAGALGLALLGLLAVGGLARRRRSRR
jgi:peptidoglycan/xylan/chitin deacetylase (PgdA/CDA1 family)